MDHPLPAHTPLDARCASDREFQAIWDRAADWWAGHLQEDKNRRLQVFPLVMELLGDLARQRVLDAGCGEGTFARLLADAGCAVTGVDFSRLLDVALRHQTRQPREIRYIKANLTDLTAVLPEQATFDAVVCNLVLHCLPGLDRVLQSLRSQLKPGGLFVVSDLHPDTFPHYSRAWTACSPVGGNQYRYRLGADCPELTLFLHGTAELESAFERNGFCRLEHWAPPAPSCSKMDAGLPQFVYYRLRK